MGRKEGLIFDIQRFCIHDGPGIRTVVFLKGCNLSCAWCQNPESISTRPEISYSEERCIHCGACMEACPYEAISSLPALPTLNREACRMCMVCVKVCPTKALRQIGQQMTVDDVLDIVSEDRLFYENSGGGVTFSGGEPSVQFEYLEALLDESGRRQIHRVVETNGNMGRKRFNRLVSKAELILFDIKHLDTRMHKLYTGCGNELILSNLAYLDRDGVAWTPRVPLIPGVNDDPNYLKALGKRLKALEPRELHLLPYHQLGEAKRKELGLPHEGIFKTITPLTEEDVKRAAAILRACGLDVIIGGGR